MITIVPLTCVSNRFRWVFCQLEVLRHCFPSNLRRILEELPKSLDDTYMRILKEINNANQEHAYRLLQCLMVASRPLLVEELAEVLAFDLSTGEIPIINTDWRWEHQEEAVLSACSSLVSIVVENGSRVVQFSHFSVKEFLTSNRLASCMEEVSRFYIPIEPSHMILAQACFGILICTDDDTECYTADKIPLLHYAIKYWHQHAQVGNVESQIKGVMDHFFDLDKPHFSAWARIRFPNDDLLVSIDDRAVPRLAAPLYVAAVNGFSGLVERLIVKHSEQINCLGGRYGTPLHASAFGGHIDVSRLLFVHGADTNSRCAENWTPLHIASQEGHLEIGKWLMNHGAEVDPQGRDGRTPLYLASLHGHLELCRILLQRNAEVNARDDHESTPLLAASEHGHLELCRILLQHNAEVNASDVFGSTPLLAASEHGHRDIAQLLLDYNADADVRDNGGGTPLSKAAYFGHHSVAQILLKCNAEVNTQNIKGSTPLLCASDKNHEDIVKSLLEHDAAPFLLNHHHLLQST